MEHYDALAVLLYVENLRNNEDNQAVLSMLKEWTTKIPSHAALHLAYVRELKNQNSLDVENAIQTADALFAKILMRGYTISQINCYAYYLITVDRLDEATSILSDETKVQAEYLLARAQLYKALGEEAKSIQTLEKAKRQGYNHPGYVLLQE